MTNPHIDSSGTKYWYNEQGRSHRQDGPAVEWSDGAKYWYENGRRHRLDGPAIEYVNDRKYWFIHGRELTEADHKLLTFACYNTV